MFIQQTLFINQHLPTEIAVHHQKVEGSHKERFIKPYEVQRLSKNVYWVSISNYNVDGFSWREKCPAH